MKKKILIFMILLVGSLGIFSITSKAYDTSTISQYIVYEYALNNQLLYITDTQSKTKLYGNPESNETLFETAIGTNYLSWESNEDTLTTFLNAIQTLQYISIGNDLYQYQSRTTLAVTLKNVETNEIVTMSKQGSYFRFQFTKAYTNGTLLRLYSMNKAFINFETPVGTITRTQELYDINQTLTLPSINEFTNIEPYHLWGFLSIKNNLIYSPGITISVTESDTYQAIWAMYPIPNNTQQVINDIYENGLGGYYYIDDEYNINFQIITSDTYDYGAGYSQAMAQEDFSFWEIALSSVMLPFTVLSIELMPGIPIGIFALIPIVFGLIAFFFSFKGGKK